MKSGSRLHAIPSDIAAEEAVFIIGAGHFGMRAARLLAGAGKAPLFVVDVNEAPLAQLSRLPLQSINSDGVRFLAEHYPLLHPESTVVPAVPVHLAYAWLKLSLKDEYVLRPADMPAGVEALLPHTWPAGDGSLLVSFADYLCPDDCPEPECCTVTGERREPALHDLLAGVECPDVRVHVIRSLQLAPGLGGYKTSVLGHAAERITAHVPGRWLLGSACRCHGVVTSFTILNRFTEARRT